MIPDVIEATSCRLPILPGDWRRHAPRLCAGMDADYLLIDLGPARGRLRYTVIGLLAGAHSVHFCASASDIHASCSEGGLGMESSLFVPLHRNQRQRRGHVAALYREKRAFGPADIEALQAVARRFNDFLLAR